MLSRDNIIKILLFLLLLLCATGMLYSAWIKQNIFSGNLAEKYLERSHNAPVLTYAAEEAYLFEANLQSAEKKLIQALKNNSFYVPAWLTLASVTNDKGEKKQANAILDYADSLTAELLKWRWDKVLVAYELGRNELLPDELRFIIERIPGKTRNSALELAYRIFPEPEELTAQLGDENLLYLFHHALRKKKISFALYFLNELEKKQEELTEKDKLWLLNTLISNREFTSAALYWQKWFDKRNIVYNGSFIRPFLRTAFGWRIGRDKDFVQRFIPEEAQDDIAREVQFRFKGWKNLNFNHFYQIIPVQQGVRYQFSASMKSEKLTTDQRPFFQISGYGCSMKPVNFQMVEPTQDWTRDIENFEVPCGCSAILLRLRRQSSRQIDNKMSGKLWIKNISITDDCEDCGPTFPCWDNNAP